MKKIVANCRQRETDLQWLFDYENAGEVCLFYYIKSVSESLLCETAGVDRKYRMSKEGENW